MNVSGIFLEDAGPQWAESSDICGASLRWNFPNGGKKTPLEVVHRIILILLLTLNKTVGETSPQPDREQKR